MLQKLANFTFDAALLRESPFMSRRRISARRLSPRSPGCAVPTFEAIVRQKFG